MSATNRDKRPGRDEEGVSEDAGAIEGYDLGPGEDEKTARPKQLRTRWRSWGRSGAAEACSAAQ